MIDRSVHRSSVYAWNTAICFCGIHIIFPVRAGAAICKFNVSGFQSHPLQAIFICTTQLVLQIDISNWCVLPYYLMYYLNYEHTGLVLLFYPVLPITALCYSSHYFPTADTEPEVSHFDRKWLTSMLKNKVDTFLPNCVQDKVGLGKRVSK